MGIGKEPCCCATGCQRLRLLLGKCSGSGRVLVSGDGLGPISIMACGKSSGVDACCLPPLVVVFFTVLVDSSERGVVLINEGGAGGPSGPMNGASGPIEGAIISKLFGDTDAFGSLVAALLLAMAASGLN